MNIAKRVGISATALGILVLATILLWPSLSPAQPVIAWTPESINETLLAGESKTISVSFTALENIDNEVDVRVIPELEPFVSTSPSSFASISAGQSIDLDVTISTSIDALPITVEGTIQLRNAGRPPRNFPKPLPVVVNIEWAEQSAEGVVFRYPPDWTVQTLSATANEEPLISITSPAGSKIVVLPEGGFPYGLDPDVTFTSSTLTIDGNQATRGNYRNSSGRLFLVRVVFDPSLVSVPDFRVDFRPKENDGNAEVLFDQILQTIQLQ